MPLHATATGKVLLASFGFEELSALWNAPDSGSPPTPSRPAAHLADLNRTRDRGWGATIGELELGLNSVAVPVRGPGDRIAGALSVSASDEHLHPDDFKDIARILTQAADEILTRLQLLTNP